MKNILLFQLFISSFLMLGASEYRMLGDFETLNSYQTIWQAPRGIWAVSGAATSQSFLSEQHVRKGKFSFKWQIPGKASPSWPYLQYRFPADERNLSSCKTMHVSIFNPGDSQMLFFRIETKNTDLHKLVGVVIAQKIISGQNDLQLDLGQAKGLIRGTSMAAEMNWRDVDSLTIYFNSPKQTFHLYIDNVHLGSPPLLRKHPVPIAPQALRPVRFTGFWKSVPVTPIQYTENGERACMPSELQIAYDFEGLKLRLNCPASYAEKVEKLPHDSPAIWNGEYVEFFIWNRHHGPGNYYQFVFTPGGSRFDNRVRNGLFRQTWDGEWRVKVKRQASAWEATVMVPWHVFDYPSHEKPQWNINLFRCNRNRKQVENTALSPTFGKGHHVLEKMLPLDILEPDPEAFFCDVETFDVIRPSLGKNEAQCGIRARHSGSIDFELSCEGRVFRMTQTLNKGFNSIGFPFMLNHSGAHRALLFLKYRGTLIKTASCSFKMSPSLRINLEEPSYKNSVYAGQSGRVIGSFELNLPSPVLVQNQLHAELKNDAGETLFSEQWPASRKINFSWSIASQPDGPYYLSSWLTGKNFRKAEKMSLTLHKLPYRQNQVYIGKDRYVYVDGKPCFILGVYHGVRFSDIPLLKKSGFNLFRFYGGRGKANDKICAEAEKHKMFCVPMYAPWIHAGKRVPDTIYPVLRDVLAQLKKYPYAIGIGIADEINVHSYGERKDMNKLYEWISRIAPCKVVQIVQNAESYTPPVHEKFCDIYELDYYDSFDCQAGSGRPLSNLPLRVRDLNRKLSPGKAIHVVLPGYDRFRTAHRFKRGRYANYRELRCLYYACIAEGATGINFWPFYCPLHGCIAEYPGWLGITKNNQEIQQMLPVLFLATAGNVRIEGLPEENCHVMVKQKGASIYIIVAYTGKEKCKAHISGRLLRGVSRVRVLAENRFLGVDEENGFSDSFAPYDVHIYTNDARPVALTSVSDNQKAVSEYQNMFSQRNSKNILYREFMRKEGSIRISVSSPQGRSLSDIQPGVYACCPYYLIDGMRRSPMYVPLKTALPLTIAFDLEDWVTVRRFIVRTENNSWIRDADLKIYSENGEVRFYQISKYHDSECIIDLPPVKTRKFEFIVKKAESVNPWLYIDDIEAY